MLSPLPIEVSTFFSNQTDSVVNNLMITTQGIFAAKSTNLNKVKDHLGSILRNQGTTLPESNYKRLIRFFKISDEDKQEFTKALLCAAFFMLGSKTGKLKYHALDGISWEESFSKLFYHYAALIIVFSREVLKNPITFLSG